MFYPTSPFLLGVRFGVPFLCPSSLDNHHGEEKQRCRRGREQNNVNEEQTDIFVLLDITLVEDGSVVDIHVPVVNHADGCVLWKVLAHSFNSSEFDNE